MIVRWLMPAVFGGVLLVGGGSRAAFGNEAASRSPEASPPFLEAVSPQIEAVEFVGLRHITRGAVQAQISARVGSRLDLRKIEADVKALGRLGWFSDVQVETRPGDDPTLGGDVSTIQVQVVFRVEEVNFLTSIEYAGSRLLSRRQIEKILDEKGQAPRLGEPANPAKLAGIKNTIQSALAELGHPQARVEMQREEFSNGTEHFRYEIEDGPFVPVGRVVLEGDTEESAKLLRQEMKRIAPGALFASWRNKNAYTREGLEEDRSRILIYYQNHGYPEARIGAVRTSVYETTSNHRMPWPFRKTGRRLAVYLPIEAGPFYRVDSVEIGPELAEASGKKGRKLTAYAKVQAGSAYSAKALEDFRHAWVAAAREKHSDINGGTTRGVTTSRTLDRETHRVRERIGFSEEPPYIVRRIEFSGLHRFSDRYLRRRIGVREAEAFDEHALEAGLARIAHTGYFHAIKKEDIRVDTNEMTHTADVTIRVSEAGRQRVSFSGGLGQFGSTLGVAYTLFDLLQREELLTAQIDGGPESLQIMLGLVMEGFLGSRASLAVSLFDNVLRPRFASSVKGPFYESQSGGLNAGWSYPVTRTDSLAVNYGLSRTNTDYSFVLPVSPAGLPTAELNARNTRSAVGTGWTHDTGSERLSVTNSISGGWLGGSENVIRSNEEYAKIIPDPFLKRQNAWAFRTTFSGAGSYRGDMPLSARLFSGDEQVRGLRTGDLGPYEVVPLSSSSGNQSYTAAPAGASVIAAANAEYRVPLGGGAHAAGFFDLGSGWLLPNWLGNTRPMLLTSTNGILHGSIGIELEWTVPEVQVPVRAYYAVNILRLNRFLQLTDGSLFHAHNRLFAFGWALGTLF
jgi:outer membrane protein insertion porin family